MLLATPACGGAIELATTSDEAGDAILPDAGHADVASPVEASVLDAPVVGSGDAGVADGNTCYTLHDGAYGPCYGAIGPGFETYALQGDCSNLVYGNQPLGVCVGLCNKGVTSCIVEGGIVICEYTCGGRATEGATARADAYFAGMAALEAISVHAFRRLRHDLRAHGAPIGLRRRCLRAARDEIRHARVMRRIASERGERPARIAIERVGDRSLEAIATENAVEGCVRETYGALFGLWQARDGRDPDLRRAMTAVASDEVRHAELSWSIHRWAMKRVDDDARARIETAMRRAIDALRADAAGPLLDGLEKTLWAMLRPCNVPIAAPS